MEILIYEDEFGYSPFLEWLNNLGNQTTKSRIIARLKRLQSGNFGDYKYLDQGIFELRLMFGSGYRIYFGKDSQNLIVVFLAGDKRSQNKDILKAIQLYAEYVRIKYEV